MELVQQGLLWAYIIICFFIFGYGVALILACWEWLMRRRTTRKLISTGAKFAGVWSLAWLITIAGRLTATNV